MIFKVVFASRNIGKGEEEGRNKKSEVLAFFCNGGEWGGKVTPCETFFIYIVIQSGWGFILISWGNILRYLLFLVKSDLKCRLNRSFWEGGIWKIGVDFNRGGLSLSETKFVLSERRHSWSLDRLLNARGYTSLPVRSCILTTQKLCHINWVAKGQVIAQIQA